MTEQPLTAQPGQCRECLLRRQVYSARHYGGGSYNRPGRNYRSSICGPCALRFLAYATPGHSTANRWSVTNLDRIVASLGTLEAAEVLTARRDREDQHRQQNAERRAR